MKILGISAYYHDSAAALLVDGRIVAAAQEERFTRIKHDDGFPHQAMEYCLQTAGIDLGSIDYVAFYDKPFLKFERLLETYVALAPRGFRSFAKSLPLWAKEKLFQKDMIKKALGVHLKGFDVEQKLLFAEHHQSHAASAFYPSPFESAAVLTMDGVGEWATTSLAFGQRHELKVHKEIHFPHSLGLLYSAFTYFCGFKVNSGEYKLMGLAPYGEPKYAELILKELIDVKEDGSYRLNMKYFNYCTGLTMTHSRMNDLFEMKPRPSEGLLTQKHMDLAASIQWVTEYVVKKLAASALSEFDTSNLCLAGGVALNCVANGKLVHEGVCKNLWIQPAAGDAGGALGAALSTYHQFLGQSRHTTHDQMQGSYLGPEFSDREIESRLRQAGARFEIPPSPSEYIDQTAKALAEDKAVGWFQGRMEFGPRALGARSIIANPRSVSMQKTLNLKIKYRESFRPFAPSILREDLEDWFDLDVDSPYMLLVAPIRQDKQIPMREEERELFGIDKLNIPRSKVPAITHVDYSARVQSVHKETNPKYYRLLEKVKELNEGCPILVNTSFNVRGEPIVCTPEDAFRCFMGTEMDLLAIGNYLVWKKDQDPRLAEDYKNKFSLD